MAISRHAVNLLWIRPGDVEQNFQPDERRIRDFVDSPSGVSESVQSLSDKLGVDRRRCRRILEDLVEQGVLRRRDFADMDSIYVRFPSR
jgi:predicted ArsR family transcriptional regulator